MEEVVGGGGWRRWVEEVGGGGGWRRWLEEVGGGDEEVDKYTKTETKK